MASVVRRSRLPTRVASREDQSSPHENPEPRFGEYLVARGELDREQLLRALQFQDRVRRIRVGESAAMLGYIHFLMVEILYEQFVRSHGFDRPRRAARV